jgi:hypothetical protein
MVDTFESTKQRAYFGNCGPQLYALSSQKTPLIRKIGTHMRSSFIVSDLLTIQGAC